jgi:rubredoxin
MDIVEGPYDDDQKCPACGHAPLEELGESCEVAEQKMTLEDYYGDGTRFVRVGAHDTGWRCPECGEMDADACVHD